MHFCWINFWYHEILWNGFPWLLEIPMGRTFFMKKSPFVKEIACSQRNLFRRRSRLVGHSRFENDRLGLLLPCPAQKLSQLYSYLCIVSMAICRMRIVYIYTIICICILSTNDTYNIYMSYCVILCSVYIYMYVEYCVIFRSIVWYCVILCNIIYVCIWYCVILCILIYYNHYNLL